MAKIYYTFLIRIYNYEFVWVEKLDAGHKYTGGDYRPFRYQQKREQINRLHQTVLRDELKNEGQARKLGEALFEAIFDENLCQKFIDLYLEVREKKQGLRIELDVDEQRMPEVAALPWELMCLPASATRANLGELWLGRDLNIVFSRRRRAMWKYAPPIQLAKGEKLRIGLAIGAFKHFDEVTNEEVANVLKYEEVADALTRLAQSQAERIELLPIVNPATPKNIDDLLEQKPHIFHFIGHGRMQNEAGEDVGQIALVHEFSKRALWRNAGFFSELFNRNPPRVVLLQACESGMISTSKDCTGFASKIVQMNIPVVVAMQYEVSKLTANQFACEFYERLAQGEAVDIAAQNGRRSIWLNIEYSKRNFFVNPVIFMNVDDGNLFERQEEVKLTDLLVPGSNLSKSDRENSPDLDFSKISLERIQQAYRKALPQNANLWGNLEENNISQILERLKEHRCEGIFYKLLSQDEKKIMKKENII